MRDSIGLHVKILTVVRDLGGFTCFGRKAFPSRQILTVAVAGSLTPEVGTALGLDVLGLA
ncbi:hypothetical protein [Streptomyces sp. NPDC004788]